MITIDANLVLGFGIGVAMGFVVGIISSLIYMKLKDI